MDARRRFSLAFAITLACFGWQVAAPTSAADYRTQNFIVMAPTADLARSVGDSAERFRHELAMHWLGTSLPPWQSPCPIRVIAGNLAAQGVTQYNRSPVRDFQMEVVGTPERILDSVLPHEVTHTILATHFGRPLPRWADEGICTTVEHESERAKHEQKLREFLQSRRGIAMNKLFLLTEYPNDVLPMYAQGYSVCQFLIAQKGPQEFVQFLGDYMQRPSWTDSIRLHYGYESLAELQEQWLQWVAVGNGPVERFAKIQPASPAVRSYPTTDTPREIQLAAANAIPVSANIAANSNAGGAGDGWYTRLRRQAEGGRSDPPSIYSAAQPQPEFGIGQSGIRPNPNLNKTDAPFQDRTTHWR